MEEKESLVPSSSWRSPCRLCDSGTDPVKIFLNQMRALFHRGWGKHPCFPDVCPWKFFFLQSVIKFELKKIYHTYCDGLQFRKELFKFPRNFLWKWEHFLSMMSVSCPSVEKKEHPCLTSHVWLRRLMAAVLRPIIIAKKQLRFFCALQL